MTATGGSAADFARIEPTVAQADRTVILLGPQGYHSTVAEHLSALGIEGRIATITAGWHTLVRVWDGREVRQYVSGLRTDTTAVTATGSWTIHKWGWQFTSSQALDEAYVPFFGAFGTAWDDATVARWNANPLGLLWPEMDAALVSSGDGGPPVTTRRPVIVTATG